MAGPVRGENKTGDESWRERAPREASERPLRGLLAESPRLELERKFSGASAETGLASFQALAVRSAPEVSLSARRFASLADFCRRLYDAWGRGPHGMLFMGLGFLLGSGEPRRYYSVEETYAIPMQAGDKPFVLGGDPRGVPDPADLILKGGADLAPRQVELIRRGQELYARSLATEPQNWLWHEKQWQALPAGESLYQLREGDYLAIGLSLSPEQSRGLEAAQQPTVLRVEAGDDAGSFRLKPVLGGLAKFSPGYPYNTSRLLPLFQQREPPGAYPVDLTRGERLKIFFTRGVARVELLLSMMTVETGRNHGHRGRLLLEQAVETAEAEWAKLGPRNSENRVYAGKVWQLLGRVYLRTGEYWGRHKNFEAAESFLTRAFKNFEAGGLRNSKTTDLWQLAGLRLFQMYRSAVWHHKRWGDDAAIGEAYEKWAEYFPFETPRERLWNERWAPEIPKSALESLQRAVEYLTRAYGELSEPVQRVREKIQAHRDPQSQGGAYR